MCVAGAWTVQKSEAYLPECPDDAVPKWVGIGDDIWGFDGLRLHVLPSLLCGTEILLWESVDRFE